MAEPHWSAVRCLTPPCDVHHKPTTCTSASPGASKQVQLPAPAVEQLARRDGVGNIGSSEQGDAYRENFPVGLGRIREGFCLRIRR